MFLQELLKEAGFKDIPNEEGGFFLNGVSVFDGGRYVAVESGGLSSSFVFQWIPADRESVEPVFSFIVSLCGGLQKVYSGEVNDCCKREEV